MANKSWWDHLQKDCPMNLLDCSGCVVGLPDDRMGNSEVGNIPVCSGCFVLQDFSKVNDAIRDGSFYTNAVNVFDRNRTAHSGYFCALTDYHQNFDCHIVFCSVDITNGLEGELANFDITQLRFAETEKCSHATFSSIDAAIHQFPVKTEYWYHLLKSEFMICSRIEQMADKETGQSHTVYPTNEVPLVPIFVDKPLLDIGCWSDLIQTTLAILDVPKTDEISGRSLIQAA